MTTSSTRPVHNLARLAESHRELVGDEPTLLFEGTWHSSGELAERASKVARGLADQGVCPGDRVAVVMTNTAEVGITYNAIWRAGAVVTPVLFLITNDELRRILTDSGAVAAVVTSELLPLVQGAAAGLPVSIFVVGDVPEDAGEQVRSYDLLEQGESGSVVDRAETDLAALLYTGGTTGRSKGVMLTHEGLWVTGKGLYDNSAALSAARGLLPLPLSHAYGLIVTIAGLHSVEPRVAVLQRWFDAAGWVSLVEEHRLETSSVVPSMLAMLLAQPLEDHDLSSMRYFGSGGAPLPAALRGEVERRLPGVEIFEGYGCTESSAVISASRPGANRPGSVGLPLPHVTVEILGDDGAALPAGEDGEICVTGNGVMQGYWHDDAATAGTVVDGWLHTGDIGHLDQDGFVYVVDRKKDLIIRGGFNVFPRDVEDALLEHPEITGAAVVGRPDERVGEEVVAVVALAPGSTLSDADIVAYARQHLSGSKYPRAVHVVDAVPLTSVGKTDRKAVRTLVLEATPSAPPASSA